MYRHEAVNFSNENQYLGFGSSYYTHVDTFSKKDDAFNKKKKKGKKTNLTKFRRFDRINCETPGISQAIDLYIALHNTYFKLTEQYNVNNYRDR